jgi:rare lipoprotein A
MMASGERYDMYALTAAHPSLPFGSMIEVRRLDTGQSVVVRINDRGPFSKNRIVDVSYAAAKELDLMGAANATVELSLLSPKGRRQSFSVQVGVFDNGEQAALLQSGLVRLYEDTVVVGYEHDEALFRVLIGKFNDPADADGLLYDLTVLGLPSNLIVSP